MPVTEIPHYTRGSHSYTLGLAKALENDWAFFHTNPYNKGKLQPITENYFHLKDFNFMVEVHCHMGAYKTAATVNNTLNLITFLKNII